MTPIRTHRVAEQNIRLRWSRRKSERGAVTTNIRLRWSRSKTKRVLLLQTFGSAGAGGNPKRVRLLQTCGSAEGRRTMLNVGSAQPECRCADNHLRHSL